MRRGWLGWAAAGLACAVGGAALAWAAIAGDAVWAVGPMPLALIAAGAFWTLAFTPARSRCGILDMASEAEEKDSSGNMLADGGGQVRLSGCPELHLGGGYRIVSFSDVLLVFAPGSAEAIPHDDLPSAVKWVMEQSETDRTFDDIIRGME